MEYVQNQRKIFLNSTQLLNLTAKSYSIIEQCPFFPYLILHSPSFPHFSFALDGRPLVLLPPSLRGIDRLSTTVLFPLPLRTHPNSVVDSTKQANSRHEHRQQAEVYCSRYRYDTQPTAVHYISATVPTISYRNVALP